MTREPLVTAAGITAVVTAVLSVVVAFGLKLSDAQTASMLGVVAVLAPLVVALVARRKVTPTASPYTDDGVPLIPDPQHVNP